MKTLLVLPKASRYDKANDLILAGPAGRLCDEVLGPGTYDVCYAPDFKAQRDGRAHVILTGQESLDAFMPGQTLSASRGFVMHMGHTKYVATFWPQDVLDRKDYESHHDDDADEAGGNGKDDAPTSRQNYRFWFRADCAKLFNTPAAVPDFDYALVDNLTAANELSLCAGSTIYFDIESHPPSNTLTCFSYAIDSGPVRTVLVYDYTGALTRNALHVVSSLARAFARNKIVIHNAGFDLPFLALYHNIAPATDVEDTMLMQHRIFPEAEKSLAHAISLWTNAPYHKSEGGTWNPRNFAQQDRLLRYNAKDVATLRAVHRAQWRYIAGANDPGLRDSVLQVNASIPDYLLAGFIGFPINLRRLDVRRQQLAEDKAQLARIVRALAGYDLNPGSSKGLANYFIDRMGLKVLSRTDSGEPCMDEANLRKYLLQTNNPIIRAILKYKRAQKVVGELGFEMYVHGRKR